MFGKAVALIICCLLLKWVGVWKWLICTIAVIGVISILEIKDILSGVCKIKNK